MRRTRFEASCDKRAAVNKADSEGLVADSVEVRKALMQRVSAGEITLEQAQWELANIKRNAKKAGKITREQAFQAG